MNSFLFLIKLSPGDKSPIDNISVVYGLYLRNSLYYWSLSDSGAYISPYGIISVTCVVVG